MNFLSQDFTTVDIGSHGIKMVTFSKKRDKLYITDSAYIILPFESIREGKIVDSSIITNKLKDCFSQMKNYSRNIIISLPGEHTIIRDIEMPLMDEEELKEAIKWESEEYLPFPVNEAILDYIIISKDEKNLKILLVAVKKEIMNSYLNLFDDINVSPTVLNIQPMALISIIEYQKEIEESLAIIDIGAGSTKVIIGNKSIIYLLRNIDIGGEEFTKMLMEENQMDFFQAEEYKKENKIKEKIENDENYSLDLTISKINSTGTENNSIMLSLAHNLAEEISRSLKYYSMKFRGKAIEKIYITGGGSKLGNLINIIESEINRDIEKIDPLKNIEIENDINILEEEYSIAIGLGLSEVLYNES